MGLFRRGTKLLRLGGGLRDCCCRPEKPEECWCPDPCMFYLSWGGAEFFPPRDYAPDVCLGNQIAYESHDLEKQDSYGMIDGLLQQFSSASGNAGPIQGGTTRGSFSLSVVLGFIPYYTARSSLVNVRYTGFATGPLAFEAEEEIFGILSGYQGSLGVGSADYSWVYEVQIYCDFDENGVPQFFLFAFRYVEVTAGQVVDYRFSGPFDTGADAVLDTEVIYRAYQYIGVRRETEIGSTPDRGLPIQLESECTPSLALQCAQPVVRMKRMIGDVELSFADEGVYINSHLIPWSDDFLFAIPKIDNRSLTELWKPNGQDPTAFSAVIKRKETCDPPPCDCSASIVGRRVLFEGREFTVGELDTILGTSIEHDGQSYWEEVSTGSFRRTDFETCGDGSYVRRVKQATVACSDFGDGVDRWYVILDHICYDRDQEECLPGFTASRERTWTGYFPCTQTGRPLGMPRGENGLGEPELIFDFTSGTLEFACLGEQGCCGFGGSGIPFISFPTPDL